MSQATIGPLPANTTSGAELATLLRAQEAADLSTHAGTTQPEYAVAGTLWLDNSASPWSLKMYTGSTNATLLRVNPSTGNITLGTVAGDLTVANGTLRAGPTGGRAAVLEYTTGAAGLYLKQANGSNVGSLSTSGNDRTILASVGAITLTAGSANFTLSTTGDLTGGTAVGNEALSTIRQRGIDALASAGTKLPLAGGTMTGPLTITYANPSVTMHNPGSRIWYMQVAGSNFRLVDSTGNYEHTTSHPNGNVTWNAVPNHGSVILSNLVHWALRGEDQRVNGLRGIRQVDGGHVGVPPAGQDYHWAYAPHGSFFRGVRKSNTAAPDAFHVYYIQGYSDARNWFTID